MSQNTEVIVVAKTQKQLDELRSKDKRIIVIEFGDEETPAVVMTPFKQLVIVSNNYHASFPSSCHVYADKNAVLKVGRDSCVLLKGHAKCTCYDKSFIYGSGDSRIFLHTDEAQVIISQRAKVYRKGLMPGEYI